MPFNKKPMKGKISSHENTANSFSPDKDNNHFLYVYSPLQK